MTGQRCRPHRRCAAGSQLAAASGLHGLRHDRCRPAAGRCRCGAGAGVCAGGALRTSLRV